MSFESHPQPPSLASIGLAEARSYLAMRARVGTPLGAAEFLEFNQYTSAGLHQRERETYSKRVKITLDVMDVYRGCFPEEYRRSGAPHFSIQREHELYKLVHTHLFPLHLPSVLTEDGDTDLLRHLEREPNFQLPFIPLRGIQRHTWAPGLVEFDDLETVFKVAHALMGSEFDGKNGAVINAWESLKQQFDLRDCPTPRFGSAVVHWSLFKYSCAVETTPLRWLTVPFEMIGHKTGNPWLDIPSGIATLGMNWSPYELMRLHLGYANAADLQLAVEWLDDYLEADPAHITRVVEIWNDAARKEEQSGLIGLQINDDTEEMYYA